jgi:hypothetical protein
LAPLAYKKGHVAMPEIPKGTCWMMRHNHQPTIRQSKIDYF